jgi:MFS family permease
MEYLQLLRQPNFAKLWFAQILSQVGQNLLNFSLIILTFDLTVGSRFANLSVALLVIAFGLPSLLFASMAGAYVDRWDRRQVLVVSNLLRAGLVLVYTLIDKHLWGILFLSFTISTVMQFFVPAETATIPKLVSKKLLLPANSLFIFSIYAAFIIGYSGSGPAIEAFGNHGPYVVVAGMMFVAALLTARLPRQPAGDTSIAPVRIDLVRHMRENWQLVTAHRQRFFSILQLTITQAVVSILVTLAPALSLALLHIPLQQASHILIIPVGLGMVLGVMMVNVVARNRDKTLVIQVCLIIAAITLTMLGLSGQLYRLYHGNTVIPVASIAVVVGMLMLILGLINAMISATAQTLLQESTSDDNRGKVFASLNMMINLAATAPILVAGLLASVLSVTKVITIIGTILTAYSLYLAWSYRPATRRTTNA